ncbi:MAG: serine/threonine protein phosphatase [Deltaproteobacteria bacterium RIFOXYD12_FULL_50_9]|nr:MAG: serine/threonine protein phosphatase [Deltaproteobacteria bacterium RIFOXYD12_FULL_50_9]
MRADRSIAYKLILVITGCSALIFAATIGYSYYHSRMVLERELEENARNQVLASVNRVETILAAIGKVTEGLARSLETFNYTDKSLNTMLMATFAGNNEIYGVCAAFEPDASSGPGSRSFAPYFYRKKGDFLFVPDDTFEYLTQDWYQIPKELGRQEWSEPYFDQGGGDIIMTTCSVPFYEMVGNERRFRGIIATDVSLDGLTDIVGSMKVLKTGYSFLLSRNGTILTHPSKDLIMNESIFSIAESRNIPSLRDIGRKMVHGESGFLPYTDIQGVKSWMYYAPVSLTGWTLAVVFPEHELLAEVHSLTLTLAAMGIAGILLLAVAVVFIAHSITTPLRALSKATEVIAAGNFDAELPSIRSQDEVGVLNQSFIAMRVSLKKYIKELTETTAAKERIQSELKVATDIQASLLPRIFPAFPDRPEFDIYATMDPAKEVGGDFYDFFFIDHDRLCFLIADVADKGVPAALYMMVAKTLLKTEAQRGGSPDEILSAVNNILAADNENCMFVTVFCALMDTRTGEVRFANAGHNPPLLIESQGIRYLALKAGFVLGPVLDSTYETERITLQPGETLFLYTDGVTEAKAPEAELYGEQRLLEALQRGPKEELAEMIQHIRAAVKQHANGAPQSDDVTMVAIKYRGTK